MELSELSDVGGAGGIAEEVEEDGLGLGLGLAVGQNFNLPGDLPLSPVQHVVEVVAEESELIKVDHGGIGDGVEAGSGRKVDALDGDEEGGQAGGEEILPDGIYVSGDSVVILEEIINLSL